MNTRPRSEETQPGEPPSEAGTPRIRACFDGFATGGILSSLAMRLVLVPDTVDALAALITVAASTTMLVASPAAAIRLATGDELIPRVSGKVRAVAWIGGLLPGSLLGTTAAAASVQWPKIAIPIIATNFTLGLSILIRTAVQPDRFLGRWRRDAELENTAPAKPAERAER